MTSVSNIDKNIKPVNSYTEWDLLEEVIVGSPENAYCSSWDPIEKYVYNQSELADIEHYLTPNKPYPQDYINRAKKASERFIHILEEEGVIVQQIEALKYSQPFSTPYWDTPSGFCIANPRDSVIVIGDQLIEAPMCSRSRYFETQAYRKLFSQYIKRGAHLVSAPKPILSDELYNPNYSEKNSPTPYVLTEYEPVFDAADFMRCGRDIIGQLSHVTNQSGVDWLQRHLGSEYNIHLIQSLDTKAAHIDTTLCPLAPGRLLVNSTFTDVNKLPDFFKHWDIIIAPEPVPYLTQPRLMSDWISINVLSLDEERIIVEKRQEPLIRTLKEFGFKPIPCDFEDYYPFIGGFHCATLDVRRKGDFRSYR